MIFLNPYHGGSHPTCLWIRLSSPPTKVSRLLRGVQSMLCTFYDQILRDKIKLERN